MAISFEEDLMQLLNRHSCEAPSGTPDFVLAKMLTDTLKNFNEAIGLRSEWRGEPIDKISHNLKDNVEGSDVGSHHSDGGVKFDIPDDHEAPIPFSSRDEGFDYPLFILNNMLDYLTNDNLSEYEGLTLDDIYIVSFTYILGNVKALVSTKLPNNRYYEVTFNKAKNEMYIDAYLKTNNVCITILSNVRV